MIFKILAIVCFAGFASGQRRYYSLEDMPDTNFDCRDKILGGYYADPEANCQMFHVCVKIPGQGVQDFRFLCPNETVFDQENQICADSGDIDCEAAGLYLENFDLYRIGSAPAKRPLFNNNNKGTVVPLGPSTKSPILTNNINEDDEFYLQRSDTGDRRLHSKEFLRGSSSSNFFNNRNKGKDLEDDDDDEPLPRNNNNNNGQYRPRPGNQVRAKTQYTSQFRKNEAPAQPQPAPKPENNQNQLNDKKRTKVAVRKLARKRPEEEESKPTPPPSFTSFTTQVTQKFSFAEPDNRYSTINRVQSTTTPPTGTTQQRYQQNFRAKNDQPSTPAFFEPSVTPRAFPNDQNKDNAGIFRQPIIAGGANFQNRQQPRPTPPAAANAQATSQNYPFNNQNLQQNRQNAPAGNFQQGRQQPQQAPRPNQPAGNINFQGPRANQGAAQANNFQFQKQNPSAPQNNNPNAQLPRNNQQPPNNFQAARTNQPVNNQNFQASRTTQQAPNTYQTNAPNFRNNQPNLPNQGRTAPPTNGNYPTGRTNPPSSRPSDYTTAQVNRQTTASIPPNTRAQTINNGLLGRPAGQTRNFFGGNGGDDFEEGDNQEFLKTAPSNNFRPSDLNSFKSNVKGDNTDSTQRTAPTSTVKYYTPTIITTPKPPSTYPAADTSATTRHQGTTYQQQAQTRNLQPQSGSTPRPQQPTSQAPANPKPKDTAYDYAYYDDGGSFSEYDSLDSLGEDFSRTSQRAKSRLI